MEAEDIDDTFERFVKQQYSFEFRLKKEQILIMHSILNGKDTFGVLPTGFGKSMCYVLPPLLLDEVSSHSQNKIKSYASCKHICICNALINQ